MRMWMNYFGLMLVTLSAIHSVKAEDIAEKYRTLLAQRSASPEDDRKNQQDIKKFLKDEREHVAGTMSRLGPEDPLAGMLARGVSSYCEPRDYLIIVTGFLDEIGKGNFDAVKGHSVVSDLLFPESEQLVGLIAMNYQLGNLNAALRKAEPRLLENSNLRKFVKNILSGTQKEKTIRGHESQGIPLPAAFSSLDSNEKRIPEHQKIAGGTSAPSTRKEPFSSISEPPQPHSLMKSICWAFGIFALLIALARVIIRRKK